MEACSRRVFGHTASLGLNCVKGWSPVLFWEGKHGLPFLQNPPLCFLHSKRLAHIGKRGFYFEKVIPLWLCDDVSEKLGQYVFQKTKIAKSQEKSGFEFFEIFLFRVVMHIMFQLAPNIVLDSVPLMKRAMRYMNLNVSFWCIETNSLPSVWKASPLYINRSI